MDSKWPKINILGVDVADISEEAAISEILRLSHNKTKGNYVVTVNPEFIMMARKDADFLKILSSSTLAVADGVGVVMSKLIYGGRVHQRITGVDMVKKICTVGAKKAITVGFLGGFGDVAKNVAKRQKKLNPKLKILFSEQGNPTIGSDLKLRNQINSKGRIDILFVAFGMGQQEFWINRNKDHLNAGVLIGVGGAFDYLAGVKKRAPKFVQMIGLEWFWRLINEPIRIQRMKVLPAFALLVLANSVEKLFKKTK